MMSSEHRAQRGAERDDNQANQHGPPGLADLLPAWLPQQRWYGGKDSAITGVTVQSSVVLQPGDPELHHMVVRATADNGSTADYQLLVGVRAHMPDRLDHAFIGPVGDRFAYDAAQDSETSAVLLSLIAEDATIGDLRFIPEPGAELDTSQSSRVSSAEQSNTSLVYGESYILKIFRRVTDGRNPDLEVHRALASVGCRHIAPPLGAIESADPDVTYAMLQEYVANAADGWHMATTSVRDLYAEADLHADEVGGDFAGEATRLGEATARVHRDLAAVLGSREAGPEQCRRTAQQMRDRLAAAMTIVPGLAPHAEGLRAAFDEVAGLTEPIRVQRVHGDFHLGQALRTMTGWVLIDFEGEPARPIAERTEFMSPLRDVAGMLRSFDYAARHLLSDHRREQHLEYRATEWAERNRDAFCAGYAEGAGEDPRKQATLLRAFELDKAVYEAVYEVRNRPTWLPIPLASIARLTG
ncbi:MAG: aminoglycoside phosphotransferase [Actinomycetota bacterium]|nr:aminoglycoside phosphotransferase [Actinomycetota bacterium]